MASQRHQNCTFAISYFVPFVIFPSFSYLAALVALASTNPAPFRMDEYHHDGQHAHLLPPYPILDITPNPSLFTSLENPSSVTSNAHLEFRVAGMFGTGAFAIHIISLLTSLLTHCFRRKKHEACGDNAMSTARGGDDEGSERKNDSERTEGENERAKRWRK